MVSKMMDRIIKFLTKNDFHITNQDLSTNLGNKLIVCTDNNVNFRIIVDRSFLSVDISSTKDDECWFDLSLVKALLDNDKQFNKRFEPDDYICMLENELELIIKLFEFSSYPSTKVKLQNLEKDRVKYIFPGLNLSS